MPPIELARLRIAPRAAKAAPGTTAPTASRPSTYLKGPIPLDWLSTAARLPGKSLHVGIALWFMGGFRSPASSRSQQQACASASTAMQSIADWRGSKRQDWSPFTRKLGRAPVVTINDANFSQPARPDRRVGPDHAQSAARSRCLASADASSNGCGLRR